MGWEEKSMVPAMHNKTRENDLMKIEAAIFTAATMILIMGCGKGVSSQEVDNCVARGVAYFKETGSYPVLTSKQYAGRRAEDEARTRCLRTTTAF